MGSDRTTIRATGAIDVVEAAYALDGSEAEWLSRILAAARADLDAGCGIYGFTGHDVVPDLPAAPVFAELDLDQSVAARIAEVNRTVPKVMLDILRSQLVTCGSLEQSFGAQSPIVLHFRGVMGEVGVKDGFGLFARDAAGGNITISSLAREVLAPAPRVRGIWRRVGLHVAAGLRLRRRLAAQEIERDALFDASGKLHDADAAVKDDKSARSVLVRAVQAMERARSTRVRSSPEDALALWKGLVAGEWSLVEQWETGGRRYVAAYRNPPRVRDPRALTATEKSVLGYVTLGATNKDVMYALGLPAGTVSAAIVQIFRKLRVKRRVDLAVMGDASRMHRVDLEADLGVLSIDPRAHAGTPLSEAEREVATFIVRGWSNDKIARERRVSPRTISNQVRAIYEKLGVASRSQLARMLTDK